MRVRATRPHPPGAAPDATIPDIFAGAVASRGDETLVVDGELRLGAARVARLAGALQHQLAEAGVGRGDVVTVQLPNRWQTIVAMHAVWGLGGVVNPVTPIYRGSELRAILASSRPRAILVPEHYRDLAYPSMVDEVRPTDGDEIAVLAVDLEAPPGDELEPRAAAVDPDDVAMLMYTSGTTGRPKGVLHTHRTLLYEASSISEVFAIERAPVFMPSPLSHVTGLLYGVLMPLAMDGSVVLMDRWDAEAAAALIEREGCTATVSATPFLRGLADAYQAMGRTSALDTFVCGGADIPAALVERATAALGAVVARTYGSTEMPTLCVVRSGDPDVVRLVSEGRLIGDARCRLADPVDGVGELEVQGPELFVGYLDPVDNEAAFTDDGWFRTGDLARIGDHDEIAIVGRLKDLIVRGGENIGAKEIEDLLIQHPGIRDVAVVGIPDELMGERACAVVVPEGGPVSLAEIVRHLEDAAIARQKFPEAVYPIDELPRTVSGKVQKFQLRELLTRALADGAVETRRTRRDGD